MLTQPIEAFAAFLHSEPQSVARKKVDDLTPLEAERVLLHYCGRFADYHDCVYWYLRERVADGPARIPHS